MRDKFSVNFWPIDSECSCEFARLDSLEEAVSLALALHRSSNVPHLVLVDSDAHARTELTLRLSVDEK